jgi:hypothetical protein
MLVNATLLQSNEVALPSTNYYIKLGFGFKLSLETKYKNTFFK